MRQAYAIGGLAAALLVAACAPSSDTVEGTAAENEAAARYADRMAGTPPPAPPSKPFAVKETAGGLEFAYAYPAEAAAVPALVDKFAREMAATKADALKMAKEDSASAKQSGYPFRPHSLETEWSVAADTPRFLALQSQTYVYTGGAHGMTGYDAVLWDKARKQESSVKALMTERAALSPRSATASAPYSTSNAPKNAAPPSCAAMMTSPNASTRWNRCWCQHRRTANRSTA